MGNYNAIAGISEENLNRLSNQIYSSLYKISKNSNSTNKLSAEAIQGILPE